MNKIKISLSKKLKWGIAGCGNYTEKTFLPTFQLLRKSKVNSIFSHSSERAKQLADKFFIPNYYNDFNNFLKSDIDIIYISGINSLHCTQVLQAAEAGKHILCEKPLALNSQEAEAMVQACKNNNVYLAVNYVYRFHPLVAKAKELITNQMLGKLVSINLNFNISITPGSNFRFNKKLSGGGALRDLGTHMIDLLRFFGGEISEIKGFVDNVVYSSEVEDFSAAIAKFENGGYGYFNVSYNNKKAFNRIEILGEKGAVSIDKLISSKHSPTKLTIFIDGQPKVAFRKRGNKLLYLLKSVQKSVLKNEPLAVSGYDGLINLKIMEMLENQ